MIRLGIFLGILALLAAVYELWGAAGFFFLAAFWAGCAVLSLLMLAWASPGRRQERVRRAWAISQTWPRRVRASHPLRRGSPAGRGGDAARPRVRTSRRWFR